MGFCIAYFIMDASGAFSFHGAEVAQYVRPKIVGLISGSTLWLFHIL